MSSETVTEPVPTQVLYISCDHCRRRQKVKGESLAGWLCCHLVEQTPLVLLKPGAAPEEQHLCPECRMLFEAFMREATPAPVEVKTVIALTRDEQAKFGGAA